MLPLASCDNGATVTQCDAITQADQRYNTVEPVQRFYVNPNDPMWLETLDHKNFISKKSIQAISSGKMETYDITWEGYAIFAFIGVFIFAWLTCLCIIIISGHTKLCGEGWGAGGDRDSEGGHGDGDGGDCGGGGD